MRISIKAISTLGEITILKSIPNKRFELLYQHIGIPLYFFNP